MGAHLRLILAAIIFCSPLALQAKNLCETDQQSFCKGVEQGKGRVLKCLAENKNKLSTPCKDQLAKVKSKMQDLKKVCEADAKKFCDGAPKGRGALMKCMKSHKEELSPACQQGMNEMKATGPGE